MRENVFYRFCWKRWDFLIFSWFLKMFYASVQFFSLPDQWPAMAICLFLAFGPTWKLCPDLKKEQSECRILPRFIGGGQPLPSKVQLSNSMAMNQNFFKSCMQKKFCWEICAIHRCCFIFQIVLITALYSSCNGEVELGTCQF